MVSLLEATESTECSFIQEISAHLLTVDEALADYFPELEKRSEDSWIMKPFSVDEGAVTDADVTAKIEFLGIREDSALKTVFFLSKCYYVLVETSTGVPNSVKASFEIANSITNNILLRSWFFSHDLSENQSSQ